MSASRRQILTGLAALPLFAASPARAEGVALRAVRIDTSGLAAKGLPNFAARVRALATPAIGRVFGGQIVPGDRSAPTLVIAIDTVLLEADPEGGRGAVFEHRRGFLSPRLGGARDQIEGNGILLDGKGKVIRTHHVYTTANAGGHGPNILPENENRRISALSEVFMRWVKSEMGL